MVLIMPLAALAAPVAGVGLGIVSVAACRVRAAAIQEFAESVCGA